MSNAVPNKVDMSLDDIIKLTKSEKRKQQLRNRRGRGNDISSTGGISRGRGLRQSAGRGVGVGRGIKHTVNLSKQFSSNLSGGRGQARGRGRNRLNSGVSLLNRNTTHQQSVQGRGRGRRRGDDLVFTNSLLKQQIKPQLIVGQQQAVTQTQRMNKVKQQALLLKEKQLALKNLQQAQKNVQTINMAIQKTSRENVVNQLRGISSIQTYSGGRKLLTQLKRQGGNMPVNSIAPVRQLSNTSVTVTNTSALHPVSVQGRKRRRWRRNNKSPAVSESFTIQVSNQSPQPVRTQQNILNQLKQLKPAVPTTYTFQKSVFAAPATGVSLNDRFSGTSVADQDDVISDGRKVFI